MTYQRTNGLTWEGARDTRVSKKQYEPMSKKIFAKKIIRIFKYLSQSARFWIVSHLFIDLMTFPGFGHTLPTVAEAILWIGPGQECINHPLTDGFHDQCFVVPPHHILGFTCNCSPCKCRNLYQSVRLPSARDRYPECTDLDKHQVLGIVSKHRHGRDVTSYHFFSLL